MDGRCAVGICYIVMIEDVTTKARLSTQTVKKGRESLLKDSCWGENKLKIFLTLREDLRSRNGTNYCTMVLEEVSFRSGILISRGMHFFDVHAIAIR